MAFSKRDRVEAALAGQAADRPPFTIWSHFPGFDGDADELSRATARFAIAIDVDFMKGCPDSDYAVEDWSNASGVGTRRVSAGGRKRAKVIHSMEDWGRIRRLDVFAGGLGRELSELKRLVEMLGPDVPVLATVFSPTTIARKLTGFGVYEDAPFTAELAGNPAIVGEALAEISATMQSFAAEAIRLGCAGIYLAVQEATLDKQDSADYARLAEPYDRQVLEGARDGWFNVVHMHGHRVMFDLLSAYPVHAVNWHIGETDPQLADYAARPGSKPVVGGISGRSLDEADFELAASSIEAAMVATDGKRLLLGPACMVQPPCDEAFLARVGAHIKNLYK